MYLHLFLFLCICVSGPLLPATCGGGVQAGHTCLLAPCVPWEYPHIQGGPVPQSGPYRPPGGVEEMQGGGRRVRLEWGAYVTV
ncbi:hypothetical protein FHG87_014891 [Trinorchestia longiramus]|nr:hypothetical protein FHG87_014891 [Trinorchestia longiramus]